MKILLLAFFALYTFAASAQRGFVINMNGDTLRGHFDFAKPGAATAASLKVSFTDDKSGTSKQYVPFQIKGWQLEKDTCFNEAKVLRNKDAKEGYGVFMRRMTRPGEVAAYKYTDITRDMPMAFYYIEKEQKLIEVSMNSRFHKQLAQVFLDNEQLSQDILNKKYKGNKEKALVAIITTYNKWFEDQWK